MMNQTINILCSTDENYVPYCGVMLTSVFESNKGTKICVFVLLDTPLSSRSRKKFRNLAERYHGEMHFVMVDKSFLESFPIKGMDYWSMATYYRLYAEELLPATVKQILYLDCDIIVTGSLLSLWNVDMAGKAVAVVPDIFTYSDEAPLRLHYPAENGYFNAGVLLMNLEFWREKKIGRQCLDFLKDHYDWIFANDQDVLNAVLWDKKMMIPITYNFQIQFLKQNFFTELKDFQEQILETQKHPIIIHYAYPQKPWMILYYKMPYKSIWHSYRRKSQWWYVPNRFPQRKTINYVIKRYLLWPLGIMWSDDFLK